MNSNEIGWDAHNRRFLICDEHGVIHEVPNAGEFLQIKNRLKQTEAALEKSEHERNFIKQDLEKIKRKLARIISLGEKLILSAKRK
jgi:type IV secretory pathway VirJ component